MTTSAITARRKGDPQHSVEGKSMIGHKFRMHFDSRDYTDNDGCNTTYPATKATESSKTQRRQAYEQRRNQCRRCIKHIQNSRVESSRTREGGSPQNEVRSKQFEILSVSILESSEHIGPLFSVVKCWKSL